MRTLDIVALAVVCTAAAAYALHATILAWDFEDSLLINLRSAAFGSLLFALLIFSSRSCALLLLWVAMVQAIIFGPFFCCFLHPLSHDYISTPHPTGMAPPLYQLSSEQLSAWQADGQAG